MKKVISEYISNFDTYTFGYALYAIYENKKDLNEIYENGFLPYTGSPEIINHFYLCRSLRINLQKWKLNTENKRVLKKISEKQNQENKKITRKIFGKFNSIPLKLREKAFDMYLNYFKNIHGENIMSKHRLEFILLSDFQNKNILYFDEKENLIGGMIFVEGDDLEFAHVWYIGYDDHFKKTGFGIWMFLDMADYLKENNYKFFYLGTAYGEKAKYKLNFEGLEFWKGNSWDNNLENLKSLLKTDNDLKYSDRLKFGKKEFRK